MASVTVANISFPFVEEDRHVKFLPLEALSLTSSLEITGHKVDFRDYQQACVDYSDPQDPANAASFFNGANQIVIIITPNDAMPVAILWAEKLKEFEPNHIIILGGYGPKEVAYHIIKNFSFIDAVIHDTLEPSGTQLINHINEDWADLPGIAFRNKNEVVVTPSSPPLESLDQLPLPAYNKVNLDKYWEIMIFSARGCPFRCTFCVRNGKLIEKSVDNVIGEISLLRNTYGQKRVFFYDQTFMLKKNRVINICNRMGKANLNDVEWSCTGRINIADIEVMKKMANSTCKMVYFGVESGSDNVLKRINKRITRSLAEKVISEAQKIFFVNTFFIWGFPFESIDDFKVTLEMIHKLSEKGIASIIYFLSPLPSSQIYKEYRNKLWFSRELWKINWPVHLSNKKSCNEIAKLIKAYPTVFPGFYTCDPNVYDKLKIIQDQKLETHFPDV